MINSMQVQAPLAINSSRGIIASWRTKRQLTFSRRVRYSPARNQIGFDCAIGGDAAQQGGASVLREVKMSTVMYDAIGMRKARSVRNRADEISEELACEQVRAQREREILADVQSLVWDCAALGFMWRSAVKHIGKALSDREISDYQGIAEVLRSALKQTLSNYQRVAELVRRRQEAGQAIEDLADFELARHEAANIGDWVECWQPSDADLRSRIREEIRRGESRPAGEFLRELLESK
jgi:hypothetical protein